MTLKIPCNQNTTGTIKLEEITLRIIDDSEQDQWNKAISEHHYLGNASMTGRRLRYVVESREHAIAFLSFSAPAIKLKGRDRWIGWDDEQRRRRLPLIIQNSRFLILPWVNVKNLASKILSLATKQLADDWQASFGIQPLLVETFVDRCFSGTGYRAAGWIRLGETAGFSRDSEGFYKHNGNPKALWIKSLSPDTQKILTSEKMPDLYQKSELAPNPVKSAGRLTSGVLDSLYASMQQIEDERGSKGKRHRLATCLAVLVCGTMAGCTSLAECHVVGESLNQTQRRRLKMHRHPATKKYIVPSHTTLWRTLSKLDPLSLEIAIMNWFGTNIDSLPPAMAIDGKAIRGTLDSKNMGLHVITAVPHGNSPFLPRQLSSAKETNTKEQEG